MTAPLWLLIQTESGILAALGVIDIDLTRVFEMH
jgi:hypothetical protein